MKEEEIYSELSSIRSLMERSSKFISLSGLSGVLAGVYALAGCFYAYRLMYVPGIRGAVAGPHIISALFVAGLIVLVLSLSTCVFLTLRQSHKRGESSWNPVSRRMMINMLLPLLSGGLLCIIFFSSGRYDLIVSSCLIFYGLSLFAGGQFTFSDVRWLGMMEIILGLVAAAMPDLGLYFAALGFGLLHIIYGSIMHFKYNQ